MYMPPGIGASKSIAPRVAGENPTPYLTPIPATTTDLVTQTIQNSVTTYTTTVNIAQVPDGYVGQTGSNGLTPAQIGGVTGGIVGFFLLLGLICCCLPRYRSHWSGQSDTSSDSRQFVPRPGPRPNAPELGTYQYATFRTGKGAAIPTQLQDRPIREIVVDVRSGRPSGWRKPRPRRYDDDLDTGSQLDASSSDGQTEELHAFERVRQPQQAHFISRLGTVEELVPSR